MRTALATLVCGLLLVSGCDCMHTMQFKVDPAPAYEHEQTAQETHEVLRATASEFGLEESNRPFWVKGAFCLFSERTNNQTSPLRALWYGARLVDNSVVVDGGMWNPGCVRERRRVFERVQMALGARLTNTFATRVRATEKHNDRIPVERLENKRPPMSHPPQ